MRGIIAETEKIKKRREALQSLRDAEALQQCRLAATQAFHTAHGNATQAKECIERLVAMQSVEAAPTHEATEWLRQREDLLLRALTLLEQAWTGFERESAQRGNHLGPAPPEHEGPAAIDSPTGGVQSLAYAVDEADVALHNSIVTEFGQDVVRRAGEVRDVQNLILTLAQHVRAQGEVVDHIAYNMDQAQGYTEAGADEVNQFVRQTERRMKTLYALLALAVVFVIAIVVAAVEKSHKHKPGHSHSELLSGFPWMGQGDLSRAVVHL